jgi:hypothetical protein
VAGAVAAVETTRTATPPEPHRVATTPPEDRGATAQEGFYVGRQRRLPRLLCATS